MKKFLFGLLTLAPLSLGTFVAAQTAGCTYQNGDTAEVNEVALDGSTCQADGTRTELEVTYITSEADGRYQKGLLMGDKNNYAKAIQYILRAQKEYGGEIITGSDKNGLVNMLLDLSYYYIKNKNYKQALDSADQVLKLGIDYRPESKSIALNNKGAALDNLGSMYSGKGYYEQALDIDYDFETANDNLDYINQLIYAVDRMHTEKITSITNIEKFYAYDDLQKQHAAKYLADFAIKILKKVPNKKLTCKFYDLTKTDTTVPKGENLRTSIVQACQLGLLSGVKGRFLPTAKITNEQFVNAISTLIYGEQKDPYSKAQEELILDKLSGDDYLVKDENMARGDAAILLFRAYDVLDRQND